MTDPTQALDGGDRKEIIFDIDDIQDAEIVLIIKGKKYIVKPTDKEYHLASIKMILSMENEVNVIPYPLAVVSTSNINPV